MSGKETQSESVPALLSRFEPQIRRYIEHRTRSRSIDDVFQETAMTALAQSASFQYRGDPQFLSWVYTIARRLAAQSRPRTGRPNTMPLLMTGSSAPGVRESGIPGSGTSPSGAAGRAEGCVRLRNALNALPDPYRQVIVLYRIEERPLAEVARILNRSKTATCHLFARALARLNEVLSE